MEEIRFDDRVGAAAPRSRGAVPPPTPKMLEIALNPSNAWLEAFGSQQRQHAEEKRQARQAEKAERRRTAAHGKGNWATYK